MNISKIRVFSFLFSLEFEAGTSLIERREKNNRIIEWLNFNDVSKRIDTSQTPERVCGKRSLFVSSSLMHYGWSGCPWVFIYISFFIPWRVLISIHLLERTRMPRSTFLSDIRPNFSQHVLLSCFPIFFILRILLRARSALHRFFHPHFS